MAIVTTKNNCKFWTLLIFYVSYWFILFPIIWFVIQPAPFQESTLATILYALLFVAVFLVLLGIIYCCFKRAQKDTNKLHEHEKFARRASVEESLEPMESPYFERKKRPVSKRVFVPTVPETATNGSVKYTRGDADRDSIVTIPLFIDDRELEKKKYVTQQALFFDGESFLGES
uniref:Golgi to ER traffic protein 2 n=1 Tax=Zeugodacus cucurbitae TaxID=28588 RepID=A0A0A1WTL9_ZEUCU